MCVCLRESGSSRRGRFFFLLRFRNWPTRDFSPGGLTRWRRKRGVYQFPGEGHREGCFWCLFSDPSVSFRSLCPENKLSDNDNTDVNEFFSIINSVLS